MARWFEHVDTPAPDTGLRTITPAELARHAKVDDCWIVHKGRVFDCSEFLYDHPGGEDLILQFAGTDVGDVLDDPIQHAHSNSAYLLMEEYLIGKVSADYVAAPTAPLPLPAAPVAGRAAGAVFAEDNDLVPKKPVDDVPSPVSAREPIASSWLMPVSAQAALPPSTSSSPSSRISAAPMPPPVAPAPKPAEDFENTFATLSVASTSAPAGSIAAGIPVAAPSALATKSDSRPSRPFASLGWGARRTKDKLKTTVPSVPAGVTLDEHAQSSSRLGKLEPLAANIRQPITRQLGRKSPLLPRW